MTVAMMRWISGGVRAARNGVVQASLGALVVLTLAGCASPRHSAPVEDRGVGARSAGGAMATAVPAPGAVALPVDPAAPKVLPGAENAGKPGYYMVKQGDTLIRIGLETGQNWKDIIRWNNLENPNVIEVGQVLRVVPPGADPNAVATRGVNSSRMETRPLEVPRVAASGTPAPSVATPAPPPVTAAPQPVPPPVVATAPPTSTAREGDDDINWMWPASGAVIAPFDESRTKGLAIGGKVGDPVVAAADGKVVYAGSGLRGYGNLVIIKHNNTYLTAYAHNQALLVKEEQPVKRGQKIAEMGSSDAERVQLHFEIRRQGKPTDPAKLLPPR